MSLMRSRAARLTLLLACLAGAVIAAVTTGVFSRSSTVEAPVSACLSPDRPEVSRVAPSALGPLRESVARVLPERLGRLYEEGTVDSANAFNDNVPLPPTVSPTERRPGGYEVRWWAPNGDDVVADVFVFPSAREAQRFLGQAASTHCRLRSRAAGAPFPPDSRNLTWVNPDNVTEADVYLLRGARVYRVADVPANQRGHSPDRSITHAFATVDTLACLLPAAHCSPQRPTVPV